MLERYPRSEVHLEGYVQLVCFNNDRAQAQRILVKLAAGKYKVPFSPEDRAVLLAKLSLR